MTRRVCNRFPKFPCFICLDFVYILGIYFKDSRSLLCVFESRKARQPILAKLQKVLAAPSNGGMTPGSLLRTPLVNFIPSSAKTLFQQPGVDTAQRRWQAREISNVGAVLSFGTYKRRALIELSTK